MSDQVVESAAPEQKSSGPASKKVAWLAMLVGILITIVSTMVSAQLPPVLVNLCDEFGMSLTEAGSLQSAIGIFALILAIPAGIIIVRLGSKITTYIVCVASLLGAALIIFGNSFEMLFAGRVLQGVGLGLVEVLGPGIAARYFPPEKRGLPIGIVTAVYTLTYFIMMNIAAPITANFSWRGLWVLYIIVVLIALVCAIFFLPKREDEPAFEAPRGTDAASKEMVRKAWFKPMVWIPAIVFILFNVGYFAIATYMPAYLTEYVGADAATANLAASMNGLAGLPAALISGWLLGRIAIGKRKFLPGICLVLLAVCFFFAFQMPTVIAAAVLLVAVGFIASFVPPALNTIGPDIVPYAPTAAIAIIIFGQNIGATIGPLVAGGIIDAAGGVWTAVSTPIAIMAVVAAVLCFIIKVEKRD